MEIEIVRVIPERLPPIIKTTPNSPRVCAKLSTTPVRTPGQASGNVTRKNVASQPLPRHHDASISRLSTVEIGAEKGCHAKGRLKSNEATRSPWNEKGRPRPVIAAYACPIGLCGP